MENAGHCSLTLERPSEAAEGAEQRLCFLSCALVSKNALGWVRVGHEAYQTQNRAWIGRFKDKQRSRRRLCGAHGDTCGPDVELCSAWARLTQK